MKGSTDKLLPFKSNNQEYLFSGYTGLLISCNEELKNVLKDPASISDEETIKYIFGKRSNDHKKQVLPPTETTLQHITVFTTDRCNLKCSYCYERVNDAIDSTNMSIETFKAGIQFFLSRFKIEKPVTIHFFGGEPLMNMDLIRDAVSYLKEIEKGKGIRFIYSLTTNGTIMNDSILDFVLENNFSIMVSIDGFKENHDYYRPYVNGSGSYEKILKNVELLSRYKKVAARITLNDMDTDIVKLYEELKAKGIWQIHVIIVSKKDLEDDNWEKAIKILRKRTKEMENYFIDNIKQKKIVQYRDLLKNLKLVHYGFNGNEKSFPCSAGHSSFCLAANGDIYLCHRFNKIVAMKLGNIRENVFLEERRKEFLEKHQISVRQGECKTCWAGAFCGGTCYHTTFSSTGETNPINQLHCAYTKEIVKSALNIYASLTPVERCFLENIN